MTFGAPAFLLVSAVAAAAIGALHLITLREPRGTMLPTARFVPSGTSVVRRWIRRPTDGPLLACRLAAVCLTGLAFARPRPREPRVALVTIVAADRSDDVADLGAVADSARRWTGMEAADGSGAGARRRVLLVLFDSSARLVESHVEDSLARLAGPHVAGGVVSGMRHGSISTALVAAMQAAGRWRDRADSVEMVLISPLAADEEDAATGPLRAQWAGRIGVVRVAERPAPRPDRMARPVVDWPPDGRAAHTVPRVPADSVGAVVAGDVVVVAAFARPWRLDGAGGRVVARWSDGDPAAVERARRAPGSSTPGSCERDVAIPIPAEGDLTLRPEFRRLQAALHAPCGAADDPPPGGRAPLAWTGAGAVSPTRVAMASVGRGVDAEPPRRSWLGALLLALAALALLAELAIRRGAARRPA